jgi:signal transduction histidine kinase
MEQGRDQGGAQRTSTPARWLPRSSSARIEDAPIFKITAAIADAVTANEVYEALVDHVADAVGASSAGLWLVDRDEQTATLIRSRGYAPEAAAAMRVIDVRHPLALPVADCIRAAAPIWIPSQAAMHEGYPEARELSTAGRSYRVSCLPLIAHGRVLGSLCLTIEKAGDAGEEEREFLLLVARYATQGLERLRLYAEAEAAAHRLRILNHASHAFADAALDLAPRMRAVAAELSRALDSCVNIALVEPGGVLRLVAAHHPVPAAQKELQRLSWDAPLPLGEGVTGKIAQGGASVILPAIDSALVGQHAAPAYRDFLERYPAYAMIGAPLRNGGAIIGAVTATRVREGQSYERADLELLEELAGRAASAIENSRLYEETRDGRTRSEQLYRFAEAVVAADRIESVFDAAFDSIQVALGVHRAAILTFDDQKVMRFRAWRGLSDGYRASVEGHSPWPADATAPQPVIVGDALTDPEWAPFVETFRREGIGALAFFPLLARGRLLGKLMLYHDRPHQFSPHELKVVRAIGYHLGSVIARFTAFTELEETLRYNELFAGMLAHDLRSPLSAIMVSAQSWARRQDGSDGSANSAARPAQNVVKSGQRMNAMIGQLLDFTQSRSGGGIRLDRRETSLDALCAQAIAELVLVRPEWTIHCEPSGDLRGKWDPDRLVQVFSNVISNAGQHGMEGRAITVRIDGAQTDRVVVTVHNWGTIPESILPELFDPFRTTREKRGQSSGLGLGLFIVREILRAHGGTVEVSSSEAAGTTVSMRLPR